MYKQLAAHALVATIVVLAFGTGCGGGGCAGLQPLPKDSKGNYAPAPLGLPSDQVIEGGLQARITKPGMDKLMATIPKLFGSLLGGICIPSISQQIGPTCFDITVGACQSNGCNGGKTQGCPINIQLTSPDGKDVITATLSDGNNPVIHIDAKFDVDVPLNIDYGGSLFCASASGSCTMDVASQHYGSGTGNPLEITADIQTGIDPTTGELTLHLTTLQLQNLNFNINGCGVLGSALNALVGLLNNVVGTAITNLIIQVLQPTLDNLVQSFLPKPLGLAGSLNTGTLLASFSPPSDANLELFVVPGGYVQGKSGGLTLGVMSGTNSDRDQTTRDSSNWSEPNLCIPARMDPNIGGAPWNLPFNAARKDFTLSPAGPFAGMPDPTDSMGATQDVAIGLSRTYLNLLGFHLYNSGTLCLHINGTAIPQLNAGTLSLVIGSLGNILEDKKAPLELVLRPQTPLIFTIGAGTMADPLIHIGITDMRIDFYSWIEERFVRIFTLALDMNLGLNLTVTKDANGAAAIQPTIVGLNAKNVTIRVMNTDLLQETPDSLAQVFPSVINIAAGALGGAIKPITLPSVAGFSLSDLAINRVQTSQDDFVGIFGDITTGGPQALIDWGTPSAPQLVGDVNTLASVARVDVPTVQRIQALFAKDPLVQAQGARPTVTLHLDAEQTAGRPVEWAYRIDGGFWHDWSTEPNPVIADDAFLLQGHHQIDVRSRVVNQWQTEDTTPVSMDVLIDSVAPELNPARDPEGAEKIFFNGFDIVTPTEKLQYAWLDASGRQSAWGATDSLDANTISAITAGFTRPLVIYSRDEAGNVGQAAIDAGPLLGFHGRTTAPSPSGCSCDIGGAGGGASGRGMALILLAMALVFLRRPKTLRAATGKIAAVVLVAAISLVAAGCGCSNKAQCSVDDDCLKMQCATGQIPTCATNMCLCVPDVLLGDIGRFSSMVPLGSEAYVSAYNNTYGDLMIGHVSPPGIVGSWDFVDGVPDIAPDQPGSHVRGGIMEPGDDVGRYTSIALDSTSEPIIAYYDKTHGSLKFAIFGVIRWHAYAVDKGSMTLEGMGDDIGKWASLSVGPDGTPGIAYSAWVQHGVSGMPESQLRWAQAKTVTPMSDADWTITVLDSRPLSSNGAPDGGVSDMAVGPDMTMPPSMIDMAGVDAAMAPPAVPYELLPEGIAIMASAARKPDGSPAVVYYDRTRGNLRYVEFQPSSMKWGVPVILDGEDAKGNDLGDVGLYSSLTFDQAGLGHISYENATLDHLYYMNTMTKKPEIVDDGYHGNDEQTQDGLPSPVWHLVGDSSSIVILANGLPAIGYQDSTVLELRFANKQKDGTWNKQYIAGHATPFKGSYGFYANLKTDASGNGVLSSYAINQQKDIPDFFVEVFALDFGAIP
jgi:hypothetical protein